MSMKTDSKRIYSYFFAAILLASLYLAYTVLSPFIHIMIMALVLASLFHPLNVKLRAKFKSPSLAAAAVVAVIVLVIILPLFFFTGSLLSQGSQSLDKLHVWLKQVDLAQWLNDEKLAPYVDWLQEKLPFLDLGKIEFQSSLLDFSRKSGQFALDMLTRLLGNAIGILMNFLIMIFAVFFFNRDGEEMLRQIKRLSPLHEDQEDRIFAKLQEVSKSVVMGSFLIAICQGLAGGIGLAIVGIPAFFWGSMMGFCSLIPVVGTAIIWIPAAGFLFMTGQWKAGLFLVGWGAILVSGIDSVLRPLIMKGKTKMSTFYVFLSILGGIQIFGPLGILYGPIILSFAWVMLSIYSEEYGEDLKVLNLGQTPPQDKL